ncbi:forkhead box protein R2 [Peromyscus californicus insignis]|uniref:forkhead box protein R2 n=1 Tax=Peromyscus californicus insignis TaxID=564181 RepID=UPI0022A745B3|nr:forkhead box protein R2 [Peromyscus californicus insignis]XP_052609350.1 forkhead box protein R2 [Peromyscus californicus insignis]XP_052609431.1 forkhead box protein R2 [Peromyscus californicus insignis]XP_052609502.1 forkhead box protein R2 [Peromyscus californicus insignis]XP_052609589.1 forkhead box protein R2 [Peromyscus californicus insignis]
MDVKLKDRDFWYSLHGQVPGLLEWDMGNEFFLPCTTDQCSLAEQSLAKYKIQLLKPPPQPQERKPNLDDDGPPTEPSLWMWVNPNIVCPANSKEAPNPSHKVLPSAPGPKTDESGCLGTQRVMQPLSFLHTEHCQQPKLSAFSNDPDFIEEETEEQECTSSNKYNRKPHTLYPERQSWPRPPLNYSHLVALALKSSPSCGLNVQQIYNFTRQHFPYFRTAPEGWKNTIRHNLCSLTCFEKVPVPLEDDVDGKPRSFLWKLTDEGHRFFQEDTRVLAYARKESIKQCMRQPELIDLLFHF